MKKNIVWKQISEIEIYGYVNGKKHPTFEINSYWNSNYAIRIDDNYIGEAWLHDKDEALLYRMSSVKELKKLADTMYKTGLQPRGVRAYFPKAWRLFSARFGFITPKLPFTLLYDTLPSYDWKVIQAEERKNETINK